MKKMSARNLSEQLGISRARGLEAIIKAQLIRAIISAAEDQGMTHEQISARSGVPRSAVTGILSGSLQKVTLDRVLKLVEAVNLTAEVKTRRSKAA
jgi:predicted XRE-type DNA-binding protein